MAKELIINASLPEIRIAMIEDGQVQELLIERDSDKGVVGNIYKGRVTRVLPGMQAAFVDIGLEKAAFLYVDDIYVHPQAMGDDAEVIEVKGRRIEAPVMDPESEDEDESSLDESESSESSDPSQENTDENTDESSGHDAPDDTAEVTSENREETSADAEDLIALGEEIDDVRENLLEALDDDEDDEDEDDEDYDDEDEDSEADEDEDDDDLDEDDEDEEQDAQADSDAEPAQPVARPEGAFLAPAKAAKSDSNSSEGDESSEEENGDAVKKGSMDGIVQAQGTPRPQRGRNRRRGKRGQKSAQFAAAAPDGTPNTELNENLPDNMNEAIYDDGRVESDRAQVDGAPLPVQSRPSGRSGRDKPEFREKKSRDRRIKSRHSKPRAQASISDLLKEGQEVIVQVAKEPIATKGARLTCHVSLPGRHLVCMPTIDHVGVSRRIERDDERRRLRDFVEKNRPDSMGFIVRTASGGKDPESWIKQDIDYLSKLWTKIKTRADDSSAPARVYEDLNSILRSIRDWVNEDIEKIIVDSRFHFNELNEFADRFMPALANKIDLYQGDIPIFDAYGISSELHRSLERRVWLKSGGYIVIDQAEALVAIDVNTGRFVGKRNLEDTILKTNLEAAEEIGYQLRLRNCGGIIIVDFIDMERDENRMRVYRALDEALKKDRARPTIQKISDIGLVEMTRKRTRDTVIRTLCEPCVHCEGKGFSKSRLTVAYEILREVERLGTDREAKKILISAHEGVVDILAIELREVVDQMEKRYNKSIYLQTILDFHTEQFEVTTDRNSNKKSSQDIARQLRIERDRSDRKDKQRQHRRKGSQSPSRREGGSQQSGSDGPRNQPRNEGAQAESSSTPSRANAPRPSGQFVSSLSSSGASPSRSSGPSQPMQPKSKPNDDDSQPPQNYSDEDYGDSSFAQPAPAVNRNPRSAPADMDDEDQLAYLRAQAAQDAALANATASGNSSNADGKNRGGRGRPGHNRPGSGRNQRGGRRGPGRGTQGSGRYRGGGGGGGGGNHSPGNS